MKNNVQKYLLIKVLFCLLLSQSCQSKLDHSTFKIIKNGQFPIKLALPESTSQFTFFKVVDSQHKKVYPAQRWDTNTLLFLSEQNLVPPANQLIIEGSNTPYFDNQIVVIQTPKELKITKNKKPVFHYQIEEQLPIGKEEYYRRGGFIHPLFSPSGKIISDDFPMGHTHQHGVFFAFVNTLYKGEKLDFWNQHQKTGDIKPTKIGNIKVGPVFGSIETEQSHISLKHGPILKENWKLIIYNTEPYRIDLHTTLQSIAEDTLFIEDYRYGGMAYRGSKVWNKEDSIAFQNEPNFHTNEGKNREEANHSRPLWSAMEGLIDGQKAGVAILGHPTNFRYPEPIRIHPSMPYYCVAPMVGEAFSIAPEGTFEAKYSFIVFDGEVPKSALNSFANRMKEDDFK